MTTKKASHFSTYLSNGDRLADGSLVLHMSHQLNWVYLQILTTDGHFRTRRYRPDQEVKVMDE